MNAFLVPNIFVLWCQILDMEESGVEVAEVMVMVVDVDGWATVQGVAITTRLSCWLDL